MKKDDIVYLRHILDDISRIEEYIKGLNYDDFMDNNLVQDGVVRQIEIIQLVHILVPPTDTLNIIINSCWSDQSDIR